MADRLNSASEVESFSNFANIAREKSPRTAASILALFISLAGEINGILADGAVLEKPVSSDTQCIEKAKLNALGQRFIAFGNGIMANMDRHVSNPAMRAKLRRVFELAEMNMQNPKCVLGDSAVPFGEKNPTFGFKLDESQLNVANFSGKYRCMSIPSGSNFHSMDLFIDLVHELSHVDQDNDLRNRVTEDRYNGLYSEHSPVVVVMDYEVDGIERSIEVLNIAMNGRLKAAARKGNRIDLPISLRNKSDNVMSLAIFYYTKDRAGFERKVRSLYPKDDAVFFTVDLEREK